MPLSSDLVVMMLLAKVQLIHQSRLLEHSESAVDGGEAQAGSLLLCQAIDLVGIKVAAGLAHRLQDEQPLWGDALSHLAPNLPIGFVHNLPLNTPCSFRKWFAIAFIPQFSFIVKRSNLKIPLLCSPLAFLNIHCSAQPDR